MMVAMDICEKNDRDMPRRNMYAHLQVLQGPASLSRGQVRPSRHSGQVLPPASRLPRIGAMRAIGRLGPAAAGAASRRHAWRTSERTRTVKRTFSLRLCVGTLCAAFVLSVVNLWGEHVYDLK